MTYLKEKNTTHFGFQRINKNKKNSMIASVFNSVAKKYDVMNDIMSFGIHRIWKKILIQCSYVKSGEKVLDIAGGTGDLTTQFANLVGSKGMVVLADINYTMLNEGRKKLRNLGIISNVHYVQTNAELLPFMDETFDCVSMSFGLRNVTEKEQALCSMHRVLKYGGKILILEFSKPKSKYLNKIYDLYSFHILPKLGEIFVNDTDSYRYLVESIRMHPNQNTLKDMMLNQGFYGVEYLNLSGGIVALHYGYKF